MFENEYAEIITVDELCEWLNIGKNTAYVLLNAGDIKAFKIKGFWKIPRGAVVEFINRKSKRPFPPSLH
ncbi:DNA-binding protein [Clostridium sp. AF19-22AC]|jgi:excisionase family DNA binding protein|uniref:helix-turn-helix domain-containing protein n=1 Tax=Clostridia TaxID=186801 RepID=UPI000E485FB5|nr:MULTISPECIES: helix-turn-helix domain-containing protein [Clostridia]RHR27105.1 DNA-binding protein [Clostridium sp. AF19-22AC]